MQSGRPFAEGSGNGAEAGIADFLKGEPRERISIGSGLRASAAGANHAVVWARPQGEHLETNFAHCGICLHDSD